MYADELSKAARRRSYRMFDAKKNMVLEDISWFSLEMEDEEGTPFVRYFGDCSGGSDRLPLILYLVPYNTKEADSLLDQDEGISWNDAIKQVVRWEEAVEINLVKR